MRVYLIVRSNSLVSLLLEVTEYSDLEVEYVCIFICKSKFQKERRVLMRKRTKFSRIISRTPQIITQLLYIEEQISNSHLKEKIHEMCCLLANQFNSVFTKPKQTSAIKDPVTFSFHIQPVMMTDF